MYYITLHYITLPDDRDDDEGDEDGKGDGEKGEEFVVVQIHRNNALESVGEGIALLLSFKCAHSLEKKNHANTTRYFCIS